MRATMRLKTAGELFPPLPPLATFPLNPSDPHGPPPPDTCPQGSSKHPPLRFRLPFFSFSDLPFSAVLPPAIRPLPLLLTPPFFSPPINSSSAVCSGDPRWTFDSIYAVFHFRVFPIVRHNFPPPSENGLSPPISPDISAPSLGVSFLRTVTYPFLSFLHIGPLSGPGPWCKQSFNGSRGNPRFFSSFFPDLGSRCFPPPPPSIGLV